MISHRPCSARGAQSAFTALCPAHPRRFPHGPIGLSLHDAAELLPALLPQTRGHGRAFAGDACVFQSGPQGTVVTAGRGQTASWAVTTRCDKHGYVFFGTTTAATLIIWLRR